MGIPVSALTSRRQILTSHLLSSSTTTTVVSALDLPATSPFHTLSDSALRQLQKSSYRLATGATTFTTHDPDPAAPDGGHVLGVRIETFSTHDRRFQIPYYLFLHRPWKSEDGEVMEQWRVHRHTFPPFVPVAALAGRWLPSPPSAPHDAAGTIADDGAVQDKKQDLPSLVRALRTSVLAHQRREDAFAALADRNAAAITRVTLTDAENGEAKIYLKNGHVVILHVDEKGGLKGCEVRNAAGKRERGYERSLIGMGSVESVVFEGMI